MNRNEGMRQGGSNVRRPRGRHNGGNGGEGNGRQNSGRSNSGEQRPRSASSLRHQTFDSNGPDVRVRGNAWQVYEKYQSLARDATSSGDRVMAENYLQHAEHYYRIIEAIEEATAAEQRQRSAGSAPGFGAPQQQPEVPSNYYSADGQLAAAQQPSAPRDEQSRSAPFAPAPHDAESAAQVTPLTSPAKAPSPFFGDEEATGESQGSEPQTLVAQR